MAISAAIVYSARIDNSTRRWKWIASQSAARNRRCDADSRSAAVSRSGGSRGDRIGILFRSRRRNALALREAVAEFIGHRRSPANARRADAPPRLTARSGGAGAPSSWSREQTM